MRAVRRRTVEQTQDGVDVEVCRQQLSDQIQLGIPSRGNVDVVGDHESAPAGRAGDTGEPRATEFVVVEQTVPVRPENRAPHDALRLRVLGPGLKPAGLGTPGQPAMMDFIPAQGRRPAAQDLVGGEDDVGVQQPEPVDRPGTGFDVSSMHRQSI